MAIPLEKKKENVDELKQKIGDSGILILSDYIGLTVAQISDLRRRLRKS
ncbi:MAG: 50S ribosomal protein L10, partial [bacterium]